MSSLSTHFFRLLLVASLPQYALLQSIGIQLFGDANSLPDGVTAASSCGVALQTTISCQTSLLTAGATYYDEPTTEAICTSSCQSSLASYRAKVASACNNVKIQSDDVTYAATFVADQLVYNYNATCLKDKSTGSFCNPFFLSLSNGSLTSDMPGSGLPANVACSSCVVQLGELSQQSSFGFDNDISDDWPAIQQLCGINFNLTIPNQGYLSVDIPPQPPKMCLSGKNYTIQSGDTCTSISQAHSVGTGNLISVNGLSTTCTTIQAGQILCLPDSCQLYQVKSGDTCNSIINGLNQVNLVQFYAWNPTINPYCTNLIGGSFVCVSPPGGAFTFSPPSVTIGPTGTQITTATPPPTQTASGTTPFCGKWYTVQPGDTCNRVILSQSITLADFISFNPEINAACSNLLAGFAYCVYAVPAPPFPSTFASVPTNAATGSTMQCYTWYTIKSNDTCASITTQQTIRLTDFLSWNPELNANCTNLLLGEAYCVFAQPGNTGTITGTATSSQTSTTTTTTTSTTTTGSVPARPSNAATGSISPCFKWYTAVSGDFCFMIAQNEGCTVAQLQTWNPALGSDCIVQLGVAYCVSA